MEFGILGPLEVRHGEETLLLGGAKQRALLALLLLEANRAVPVERLIDGLWEEPPESGRKMVQIHVSQLRKLLPEERLRTRPPGYLIELATGELDLERVEALLREGRDALRAGRPAEAGALLRDALALWRGPALAEFAEPFAPTEAARLEELRLACLEERIEADLACGRHAEVIGELETLVVRQPLRERMRGQLMLALYRSGRHAEALAAYKEHRRRLDDELGIEPSQPLRELERRILQQDGALDAPAAAPPPTPAAPTAPAAPDSAGVVRPAPARPRREQTLVGRDGELGQLRRLLDDALEGERRVVFVSGEAGIGKTTLVEAFLAASSAGAGLVVARGQCIEHRGAGEAYLPVLDALGRLGRGPHREELAELLVARAPSWLVQLPGLIEPARLDGLRARIVGTTRERMLREITEALEELSERRPVALVLEDVHWTDYSTVDLLDALARRREPARLLVLATLRPPGGDPSAVHEAARQLCGRGLAVEIALAALDPSSVAAYLEARLDGSPVADELAGILHQLTAGNPLFVEKVLEAWIDNGAVERAGSGWRVARPLDELRVAAPESLRQLIEQQLLTLEPDDRLLLEAAGVAGTPFSAAAVAAAAERPEDQVEDRLLVLARAGVFVALAGCEEWPDGTVTSCFGFTHDLWEEVLYDRVGAGRRARLHGRVGMRLVRAYGERAPEIAPALASHFVRANDADRAVVHLVQAAEQALARSAHPEALGHLQTALAMADGVTDGERRASLELAARMLLGPTLIATQGWSSPEAERALLRARELAESSGSPTWKAQSLYGLGTLYEVTARYRDSQELMEEALGLVRQVRTGAVLEFHELLACSLFHQGEFDAALRHAEEGISVYDDLYVNALMATYGANPGPACHTWAGLALWFLGYPERARKRTLAAVEVSREPGREHGLSTAQAHMAMVSQCRREIAATLGWAEAAMGEAARRGFAYRVAMGRVLRGWAVSAEGASEDGLAELRDGIEQARRIGARMDDPYFLALLADALVRSGRAREALQTTAEALAAVRESRAYFYEAELHRLRAEALLALDRRADAESAFLAAHASARAKQARSMELRAAVGLGRLRRDQGRVPEASRLVADAYAWFSEGFETADLLDARALLDELGVPPEHAGVSQGTHVREPLGLDDGPATLGGAVSGRRAAPHGPGRLSAGPQPVRYARTADGLDIAYQVSGGGPTDVVLVPGFVSHLELDWEEPRHAAFLERLGSFSRLVRFDKRGTGLSDRPADVPDLETRMDDVRAVMDAVGSDRAVLFGYSEGGPMSLLFAATYPDRVAALVLYGVFAKRSDPDADYPWAPTRDSRARRSELVTEDWGLEAHMRMMCPSADDALARWWSKRCRAAASPGAVRALVQANSLIDVRDILGSIHVPTLVVHRTADVDVHVEEGRYIAERVPGAHFVELSGTDHFVAVDPGQILDAVEPFVTSASDAPPVEGRRVLATILVTDAAGSTGKVTRLGDEASADLLARHDRVVRDELERYAGEAVDTAGDGLLALFDGPSRAIRCGEAVRARLAELDVPVRAGVHTGEIERRGSEARGIAVHVAARVAAEAEPGEVLVTATTRDLVAGSGLVFVDRGERALEGSDEPRRLFAVVPGGPGQG